MLKCYRQGTVIPKMIPARPHRDWMDRFPERHPYRCLPMAIANSFGWELLSPCDFKAEWNGGPDLGDIKITAEDDYPHVKEFALSNFSHGVLSFHTGYLFVTNPGWQLLATGPFNEVADGIVPLTAVIETEWLPYPFAMSWKFTRPGTVRFKKDQPFCHVLPVQIAPVLEIVPEIYELGANPQLRDSCAQYRKDRSKLLANQQKAAEQGGEKADNWSKQYLYGKLTDGTLATNHYQKLRLAAPVDKRAQRAPIPTFSYGPKNPPNT
jgi:hypothetical protein